MIFDGFIGPAYRSRSIASSGDLLQNLFAEPVESGKGSSPMALYGTPGLSVPLVTLDDFPVRGFVTLNGRTWVCGGSTLYEIINNGAAYKKLGIMLGAGGPGPASLITDGKTLVVAASGRAFYYQIGPETAISAIDPGSLAGAGSLAIQDGFFLAAVPNTQQFQYSAINDGTTWPGLNYAAKNGYPDNLSGLAVMRRQLWLMGGETSEIWWLAGGTNNPFQRLQGVFLETGLSAAASLCTLNETLYWIGRSRRGQGIAWMASGFAPQRVSTFAIEYAMSRYARLDDAVGYTYEEGGHRYWVVTFPSAYLDKATGVYSPRTWALDVATNYWHERCWLNPALGTQEAVRGWVHTFNWGMHLVGDRINGNIYQQAQGIFTDNGQPIKRVRRAPLLMFENKVTTFHRLELLIQAGEGVPQKPAQGSLPVFSLRISRDGGYTFGAEIDVAGGAVGEFGARVFWGPLGAGRREVFEISSSEPIDHCWLAATFEASPGVS